MMNNFFLKGKESDEKLKIARFIVGEVIADELRYLCFKPLNTYSFKGKPIEYVYLNKDNSIFYPKFLPKNSKELEGNEVDIFAEDVTYHDFCDYKDYVIEVDKYTVVM